MAIITSHPSISQDGESVGTVRRLVAALRHHQEELRAERHLQETIASLDEATLKDVGLDKWAGPRP